nr:hypothetical protein [Kibdelosporangium sp. MJ126-NF4]CTQ90138.1 hypothetical protein [Kibdelosporangium sp. MJ126-NF4]
MWSPLPDPDGTRERTASWWKGLRAVLSVLCAVAQTSRNHEALAMAARALIAVGDSIVNAGRHKRS